MAVSFLHLLTRVNTSLLHPAKAQIEVAPFHPIPSVAIRALPPSPVLPTANPSPHSLPFQTIDFSAQPLPLPSSPPVASPEGLAQLQELLKHIQFWMTCLTHDQMGFFFLEDPTDSTRRFYAFSKGPMAFSAECSTETKKWILYPKNFPDLFLDPTSSQGLSAQQKQLRLQCLKDLLFQSCALLQIECAKDDQGETYLCDGQTNETIAILDKEGVLTSIYTVVLQQAVKRICSRNSA